MFRSTKYRNGLSTLFLGVYLFVALASQSFHHHSGAFLPFQDGNTAEKSISNYTLASENSGCLWCHFLHSGHTFLPETFTLELQNPEVSSLQNFIYTDHHSDSGLSCLFLRGPPTDIV